MNKEIFKYNNGREDIFGDPVDLMEKFVIACGGNYQQRMKDAFPEPYPEQPEANAVVGQAKQFLIAAVRKTFDLVPFDPRTGSGATAQTAYDTIHSFMNFWFKKKESTEPAPMSPTPSDSADLSPTTTSSVDSGQTPSA